MNGIPNPGEHLDHFLIEKTITRGGMATLLRATDTRTGAPVAIKIPHPELECDPLFFDRFHREADLGRKLDHPCVIKVLPQHDPCRVYMVTEWVEGRPLRLTLEEQGKFAPDRAIQIALQICEAVAYIHSLGVVQRDLKPENIMLGEGDSVKLIDFGLAGEVAGRRLTFAHITKSMGTPDYISPEQVKGKRGDKRSDVYALGIILYEMLTGQVPFRGPNPLVSMNQRLMCDPEPASHFDETITPQMEEILWHALERDPRLRYPSARHLAIDLRAPDNVPIKERVQRDWETSRAPKPRAILPLLLLGLHPRSHLRPSSVCSSPKVASFTNPPSGRSELGPSKPRFDSTANMFYIVLMNFYFVAQMARQQKHAQRTQGR